MSGSRLLSLSSTQGKQFTKWDFQTPSSCVVVCWTRGWRKLMLETTDSAPSQGGPCSVAAHLHLPSAAQEGSPVPRCRHCRGAKPAQVVAVDFMETWTKRFHFQKVQSQVCFRSQCSTKQVAAAQRSHCQSI